METFDKETFDHETSETASLPPYEEHEQTSLVSMPDKPSSAALHEAVINGQTKAIEVLLLRGVDINARDDRGGTALMRAADMNNVDAFGMLLSHGADVCAVDSKGRTVLHSAAVNGANDIIATLMDEYPKFSVHCKDDDGLCPFDDAALHGHTECMRLLSNWGRSPFHQRQLRRTCRKCRCRSVVHHSFDDDDYDDDDDDDLHENTTLLHDAAASGKTKVLDKGLDLGFNIDGKDSVGGTALMRAADRNNVPAFKFLLANGADLYAVDSWGRTALHSAAVNGASDIIAILIEECPRFDVNWRDYEGLTPLHDSGRHGYTTCINMLLDLGADPYIRDNSGRLPALGGCHRTGINRRRQYVFCCF